MKSIGKEKTWQKIWRFNILHSPKKKIAFLHTVCNMVKYFICTPLGLLIIKVRLFSFYDFCKYASCFLSEQFIKEWKINKFKSYRQLFWKNFNLTFLNKSIIYIYNFIQINTLIFAYWKCIHMRLCIGWEHVYPYEIIC